MRFRNRSTTIILALLFLLVTGYVAVDLYALPGAILQKVGVSELSKVASAEKVAQSTYYALILDFFLVLLLFVSFSAKRTNADQVGQSANEGKENDGDWNDASEEGQSHGHELGQRLDRFKSLINTNKSLQGNALYEKLLASICKEVEAVSGAVYLAGQENETRFIEFVAGYAFHMPESQVLRYEFGEGIAGQVAKSGDSIKLQDLPEGYITVFSGLGKSSPTHLLITPIKLSDQLKGVVEIATFKPLTSSDEEYIEEALQILTVASVEDQVGVE